MTRIEAGRKGGGACLAKHGRAFYREIGKRGFLTTVARHGAGDRMAYRRYLAARGWNSLIDTLADREIDRRLSAGERTVCPELTVIDDLDLTPI